MGGKLDWWLIRLCFCRVSVGLVLMNYAAVMTVLISQWGMSAAQAGSIASGNHLGHALSLVVCSALADRIGAKTVFLWSISLAALASAGFALFAHDYWSGLILYTLVGLTLGGTYPPALMILADRYPAARRGRAMGAYIASTSLGYTICLLLAGALLVWGGYRLTLLVTGLAPTAGAIVAWWTLARTKIKKPDRIESRSFAGQVLRNKPGMLLIGGYTFHNYELLGMWAWTPAFLAAGLAASGDHSGAGWGSSLTAAFHVTGLLASFTMGALSDRLGRARMLVGLAALSAACSFFFGFTVHWSLLAVMPLGMIYSFVCLGDSPILSAALTESINPAYIGSAFGLRSLLGFGVGAIAPAVFGWILDLIDPAGAGSVLAWGIAFASLGLSGLGAVWCAAAFGRLQQRAG